MKTSTRTILFFLFASVFIVSVPIVSLYSQGYRLDWDHSSLVKTGALYLEPRPVPAEVYINQKLEKKSHFVSPNLYIGNLIPKTHSIEIKKEGYSSWKKNLAVYPKLVTEARHITLFPKNSKIKRLTSHIENFYFAPSQNYIATVEKGEIPQINLYAIDAGREFLLFRGTASSTPHSIPEIQWSHDSSRLAFKLEKRGDKKWFILDIENEKPQIAKVHDLSQEIARIKISQLKWSPNDRNLIFITTNDAKGSQILFAYNLQSKKLSQPLAEGIRTYSVLSNKIMYILDGLETISSLDLLTFSPTQELYSALFSSSSKNIEFIEVLSENRAVAILAGKEAYLASNEKNLLGPLEKISSQAEKVLPDSSGKKLLIAGRNQISVYWLRDSHIQHFRDAYEKIKILETRSVISDAIWFSKNDEYIIFSEEDYIKVVELDTRDAQNIHDLAKFPHARKLHYKKKENFLYFLSDNALYQLSLK